MSRSPQEKFWKENFDLPDLDLYTPVPLFFMDELIPRGKAIPAPFWKFLLIVWRDVVAPGKKNTDGTYPHAYKCTKTSRQWSRQHHIPRRTAMDCIVACDVSGLFDVRYGFRDAKDKPGVPTVLRYRKESSEQDWIAFINGLSAAYVRMKLWHQARRGRHTEVNQIDGGVTVKTTWGVQGYLLQVALCVDEARAKLGLRPVNRERIDWLIQQGAGKRESDGSITISYVTTDRSLFAAAKYGEYCSG